MAETGDSSYLERLSAESKKWGDHLAIEAAREMNAWLDHPSIGAVDPVVKEQSQHLMALFVQLFDCISPAWASRSSFCAAAVRISGTNFPPRPG